MYIFTINLIFTSLNTIIVPLFFCSTILGVKIHRYISFLYFFPYNSLNLYDDFNIGWYVYFAPYYFYFMMISIIKPII
jgi:hypothetical protein